jgi:serine/threonine protein kinase
MDPAFAPGTSPKAAVFHDGLGERRRISDVSGADTIEQLCLRSDLTAIPSFEFALRERASRLASFRHVYYARVRSVDRLTDPASTLTVVSDSIKGVRLANLLTASERRPLTLDINASLHLLRQLVSAVAMLHETARDVAHGALGPERIIVTPNARVVIAEYVLGAALEQLRFSRERYWKELRVPLPPSSALPRFDHRADVTQIGAVALALVLGRLLREDEYPNGAGDVLALASAISAKGEHQPLPSSIRTWIGRALQLDPKHSFATALEARDALDRVLSGDEDEDPAEAVAMSGPVSSATAAATSAVTPVPAEPEPVAEAPAEYVNPISLIKPTEPEPAAPAGVAPTPKASPEYSPPTSSSPFASISQPYSPSDSDEEDDVEEVSPFAAALSKRGPRGKVAAIAVALIAVSTVGVFAARKYLMAGAAPTVTGTLSINSNPPGATVVVDGQTGGITPLTLALKPGPHNVELHGAGEPRTVPVTITAGTTVSQYIELPKMATAFGQLQVKTEPAGAQVTVDGIPRGKSPVLIEALAAGEHAVSLDSDSANVKQTVTIEAGVTASLVVPLGAVETAPLSGWVSVSAPVELQLYEGRRLLGSSQSDRVMVTAGKHEIELVNEIVGYRATRTVQVPPGKVAAIKVEWPKGTIAINALPWADVWIDGERIGETPIGNLALPIGPHEILFRHPELGEQKYAATVTLAAPARVSVDLRKK